MKRTFLTITLALVAFFWTNCSSAPSSTEHPTGIPIASAHSPAASEASAGVKTTASPNGAMSLNGASGESGAGKVTEVIPAGQYVYVCVNSGSESRWLAASATDVQVGDSVEFKPGLLMKDFESPSMGRIFPAILFVEGIVVTNREAVPVSRVRGLPSGHPAVPESARSTARNAAIPKPGTIPVRKDALSIQAVQQNQESLNGKTVAVVGMVSRVSENVMDRNWIHLVDESGLELVITSSQRAAPGTIQVARGTLVVGKTFKTGYFIPLVVEESTLASGS